MTFGLLQAMAPAVYVIYLAMHGRRIYMPHNLTANFLLIKVVFTFSMC